MCDTHFKEMAKQERGEHAVRQSGDSVHFVIFKCLSPHKKLGCER